MLSIYFPWTDLGWGGASYNSGFIYVVAYVNISSCLKPSNIFFTSLYSPISRHLGFSHLAVSSTPPEF